uniref:Uncharacterized protein n=1 Tax=Moniliophthora roreri TaxID=221103 RepID=A0A0W0FYZ0_MONRR
MASVQTSTSSTPDIKSLFFL